MSWIKEMITSQKIVLRQKRLSDALNDYTWLTDPDLAQLDATHPGSLTFAQYLRDCAGDLYFQTPNRHPFAVDTLTGQHIGNCAYYNVDWPLGVAEVGIMIGNREYWNRGYGSDAMQALTDYIFRNTSLTRLHLKTLEFNERARQCFQKCGFLTCGTQVKEEFHFILMELHREQWLLKEAVPSGKATRRRSWYH
jgi:RimJ/RimL family protein N-acetyltransferase